MADLIFDWDLLERAKGLLDGRPEEPARAAAGATTAAAVTFGSAPGGAAAADRLTAWLAQAATDLTTVSTEVTGLSASTGEAAGIARQLDPETRRIAQGGTGPTTLSSAQVAEGNAEIAAPVDAPGPDLEEG